MFLILTHLFHFRFTSWDNWSRDPLLGKPKCQRPNVSDHVRVEAGRSLLLPPHREQLQPDVKTRADPPSPRSHANPQSFGSAQATHAFKGSSLLGPDASPLQEHRGPSDYGRSDGPARHDVHVRRCCHLSGTALLIAYIKYWPKTRDSNKAIVNKIWFGQAVLQIVIQTDRQLLVWETINWFSFITQNIPSCSCHEI